MAKLHIRRHLSSDYQELPDIDASQTGTLTGEDRQCLAAIGTYFGKSQAASRFGISLLHQHFPIHDTEILLQTISCSTRSITVAPHPISTENTVPVNMRFAPSSSTDDINLIGLEYVSALALGGCHPVAITDVLHLAAIRRILQDHNRIDRFGVRLRTNHFTVSSDEILLETCNKADRTLFCNVTPRDAKRPFRTIETLWYWLTISESSPHGFQQCTSYGECVQSCAQECTNYTHDGHNRGHIPGHSYSERGHY